VPYVCVKEPRANGTLPKNTTGFIAAIAQATCIRKNNLYPQKRAVTEISESSYIPLQYLDLARQ
jgi:hypothetical protein